MKPTCLYRPLEALPAPTLEAVGRLANLEPEDLAELDVRDLRVLAYRLDVDGNGSKRDLIERLGPIAAAFRPCPECGAPARLEDETDYWRRWQCSREGLGGGHTWHERLPAFIEAVARVRDVLAAGEARRRSPTGADGREPALTVPCSRQDLRAATGLDLATLVEVQRHLGASGELRETGEGLSLRPPAAEAAPE